MSGGSLRDQLKALGLVKPTEAATVSKPPASRSPARVAEPSKSVAPVRTMKESDAEISLAKAYAAKQAAEQAEAADLRRQQEEKARLKRERKAAALRLLDGKSLVKPDAEFPRYFEYGKKIRRIYVDDEQMRALNAGMLGVAQLDGRFLLVDAVIIEELQRIAPEYVALRVDPKMRPVDDLTASEGSDF